MLWIVFACGTREDRLPDISQCDALIFLNFPLTLRRSLELGRIRISRMISRVCVCVNFADSRRVPKEIPQITLANNAYQTRIRKSLTFVANALLFFLLLLLLSLLPPTSTSRFLSISIRRVSRHRSKINSVCVSWLCLLAYFGVSVRNTQVRKVLEPGSRH